MTRIELIELGEKYCELRPGSQLADVNVKENTIITYYRGAYLTSDADKVKAMLGIDEDASNEKSHKIA